MASGDFEGKVILPVTQDQFGAFISKLLGRPQTVRGRIFSPFDVTQEDIINLHHLIDQRIAQNSGALIEFMAEIFFNDHSSVELNSLNDFKAYREVSPLISTGLKLFWSYLIKFPHSEIPEKQTIEIFFSTTCVKTPHRALGSEVTWSLVPIQYEIAHTSRTWGGDMESLLKKHLERLTTPDQGIRKFIVDHNVSIGIYTGLGFLILATFGAVLAAESIADLYLSDFSQLLSEPASTIHGLSQKFETLTEFTVKGTWHRFNFLQGVYFIASIVIAAILGIWVCSAAENDKESFLQLTDSAKNYREYSIKKRTKNWWNFIASGLVTVVAGILSRMIFYYITKWWLT